MKVLFHGNGLCDVIECFEQLKRVSRHDVRRVALDYKERLFQLVQKVMGDPAAYERAIYKHPGYWEMVSCVWNLLQQYTHHRQCHYSLRDPGYPVDCLEIGPGSGSLTAYVLSRAHRLAWCRWYRSFSFVEPDSGAVEYLTKRIRSYYAHPKVFRDLVDVCDWDFEVVYGTFSFHHFPDKCAGLDHIRRLLTRDGVVLVGDEFIMPYRSEHERVRSLFEYHGLVIQSLMQCIKRMRRFIFRASLLRRFTLMARIELLALLNGILECDERKISLEEFHALAHRSGFCVSHVQKVFPIRDIQARGIYVTSLVLR